jgi:hypothetical protein
LLKETPVKYNAMKITFVVALFFIPLISSAQTSDRELVQDYVDALYLVKPELIQRSVHPQLTKKGFWRKTKQEPFGPEQTMTFDQLVTLAGKWNVKGTLPKDAPRVIEIFDVQDQTASAKLTAQWGTDYFQLAKYEDRWMIVNVLWQSPARK